MLGINYCDKVGYSILNDLEPYFVNDMIRNIQLTSLIWPIKRQKPKSIKEKFSCSKIPTSRRIAETKQILGQIP